MKSITDLLITENDLKPKYKLYCDLDGVLCHFKQRFDHFTGMTPKEYRNKYSENSFWNLIDVKIGIEFWSKMGWTPKGRELWNFINDYNPTILTSPSRHDHSRIGKKVWVKDNLSPTPKVIFKYSKEKQDLSNENSILIDDKDSNIREWRNQGGIGIHHPENTTNIDPVIQQLKELGYK